MDVSANSPFSDRHILLGVTGGVAAYKCAELTRRLRETGAAVRVVMTEAATRFVAPLTFQALSGQPVRVALFDEQAEAGMGHIELARWADFVVVAPASADFLARLAAGLADDLLATLCLVTAAPIAVAPAMNTRMWEHPATRANCATLAARGVRFIGPAAGGLACGEEGAGRMAEPAEIVAAVAGTRAPGGLAGVRVMVTAGPTREAIDPVRYIGNRSSGRMGYAVAAAACAAGARVTLVSGPTALPVPVGVERITVESAEEMLQAVMASVARCDLFIAAAAVADYRPVTAAPRKIKKSESSLSVELVRNPDILSTVAALEGGPFTVGFAAETDELEVHARDKLRRKGLDMVAANWVGRGEGGFESERNALHLFWAGGGRELPMAEKGRLAEQLVAVVAERFREARNG
ncbi:bifunctional phosphopantothenoylcysteine decarboxylase/phosphopantothenate--cysteine ligase CoaBC [Endothiovibrio diazotrophicus]